jgi:hypothetical protein
VVCAGALVYFSVLGVLGLRPHHFVKRAVS